MLESHSTGFHTYLQACYYLRVLGRYPYLLQGIIVLVRDPSSCSAKTVCYREQTPSKNLGVIRRLPWYNVCRQRPLVFAPADYCKPIGDKAPQKAVDTSDTCLTSHPREPCMSLLCRRFSNLINP